MAPRKYPTADWNKIRYDPRTRTMQFSEFAQVSLDYCALDLVAADFLLENGHEVVFVQGSRIFYAKKADATTAAQVLSELVHDDKHAQ